MKKAYLYIGSNNETHELEQVRAEEIIATVFEGFSAFRIAGYWKGQKEKTLKVEIVIEDNQELLVVDLAKKLAKELNQQAIMIEIVPANVLFIQA
jgi:hypothetical protein